ncbi:MAG TPA: creatininase family protein, partial [Solirubrobacteraceae bacterium]|nr:creatininase family protein [Solirubrobacteraceae bacterium]
MNTVLMEDLTAPVIRERSKAAVLFIPLGSIEQHGPHMPIDTDSLIAARISEAVARRIGGLVGPRMNYGCRSLPISGGGELFPGTISLRGATFSAVIADLVTAYADHGHPRIVILNGHYENTMFAIDGAKLARERGSDASVVLVDWWTVFEKATLDTIFEGEFPGWEAEH